MVKYVCILLLLLIAASWVGTKYGLTDDRIQKGWWKMGDPIGLPDVLVFDKLKGHYLKNDTVFISHVARAIILQREFRIFADHKLTLKNITHHQVGSYYQK